MKRTRSGFMVLEKYKDEEEEKEDDVVANDSEVVSLEKVSMSRNEDNANKKKSRVVGRGKLD